MSLNRQVAEQIASDMKSEWGDRFPSWREFKAASREGRIQVNRTVAAEAISWVQVPTPYRIFYGFVTMWIAFLALPITLVLWLSLDLSAWWIAGSLIGGWFLLKVSREGHCEGIKVGAERDEAFYQTLVENGAFWFLPES